jgi:hypothetical protein
MILLIRNGQLEEYKHIVQDVFVKLLIGNAQGPFYGQGLISILEDLIYFSIYTKKINNHHIWWYCVKILNNIPNTIIAEHLPVEAGIVEGKSKLGFKAWLNEFLEPSQSSILAISNISESLLPKFLGDQQMIPYAETIIEAITRIKPSGKKSAFTKEDEADLIWDEHWISKAFQEHGKEIGAKCPHAVQIIADRLRLALEYKRNEYKVVLNINGQLYQLKVVRVPQEKRFANIWSLWRFMQYWMGNQ